MMDAVKQTPTRQDIVINLKSASNEMQEAITNTHETITKYTQLNVMSSRTVKVDMRHR